MLVAAVVAGCGSSAPVATPSPTSPTADLAGCARTINVATDAGLSAALGGAAAGDCIVLANGSYSGFSTSARGTAASPIRIVAASRGGTTISSGGIFLNGASYVIVDGLRVTGYSTRLVDETTRRIGIALQDAQSCRITRCWIQIASPPVDTHWVGIGGNSNDNQVDHCDFGPFTGSGKQVYIYPTGNSHIAGVTPPADRTPWAEGRATRRRARRSRLSSAASE